MIGRLILALPALVLILAATADARGQASAKDWVGRRVLTKFGTDLKEADGKFTADSEQRESRSTGGERRAARVYKVVEADGGRLRLVSEGDGRGGWARPADLVPLDKAEAYFNAESKKLDDKMVEVFKQHNVQVITLTPAEAEAWRAVAQKTSYKDFAEKVPGGKELIEKALAVR